MRQDHASKSMWAYGVFAVRSSTDDVYRLNGTASLEARQQDQGLATCWRRKRSAEAQDEWITFRWEQSVLITEQTKNSARQQRTTRTQFEVDGRLLQDVRTNALLQ